MAGPVKGTSHIIRSSLPYQVLLYCNAWYFGFFFIAEILLYIYKGEMLPFANGILVAEVIILFLITILEIIRIFLGQKGNLTERMVAVILSLVISIPVLIGIIYLLLWQTYVLRVEVILCGIELTFLGLELIFSIVAIVTFARATPY
ncbi:transmembrane protein 216-like [Lineus longissimus]|uniref:transmembrane protein 216-like n=1 Tax=Lineus longissimus TaxID=88925 RepID=UPI002B4D90FE